MDNLIFTCSSSPYLFLSELKPSNMEQFFPKAAIIAKSRYSNSAENAADVFLEHRSIIQDFGKALISRNSEGEESSSHSRILKAFKFGFRILLSRNILWGFSNCHTLTEQ
ncbi:hypothetical protein CEXT_291591 [Caerostris extrusa]|uniref:Uncharacterized protein n=1 Tax=Caerostris extrusa TaxID=172846 RepID=A0AAV4W6E1_CAEEX|nr:hypothetical protein CEXT_291591 [Caerostris extrusa]